MDGTEPRTGITAPAQPASSEECLAVVGSHTRLLTDPDRAVLIEAGTVDLFVVRLEDDKPQGPREPLCTLAAGAVLFAAPPSLDDRAFLAVAWDGAVLRTMPMAELRRANRRTGVQGCDAWLDGVTAGLARRFVQRPRPQVRAAIGDRLMPSRQDRVIAARSGVVWLRGPDVSALLAFGLEEAGEGTASLMPVTREGWVTGHNRQPMLVSTTPQALASPSGWAALEAVNAALLAVASTQVSLALVDEHHRLAAQRRNEQRALRRAVDGAVAVIGDRPAPDTGVAASDDRLFLAVQRVAQAGGMAAHRPVKVREADADVPPTLEQIAHASRFRLRRVRLPDGWWRCPTLGPLLAAGRDGHPLALLPTVAGYTLYDPADGRERPVDAALAQEVAPTARVLTPTLSDHNLTLADLVVFGLDLCRGDLAALALTIVMAALLGMTVPLAIAYLFDAVIPGRLTGELWQIGMVMAVVAVTTMAVRLAGEIARLRIDIRLGERTNAALLDRVLRLPSRFFGTSTVGELAARIAAMTGVPTGLRQLLVGGAMSGALMLGSLAVLAVLDRLAAGVGLVMLVIQLAAAAVAAWLQLRAFRNGEDLGGLADGVLLQILTGVTKLRLAAAENRAFARWSERFTAMRARAAAARRVTNGYEAFLAGFAPLSTAALFLVIAGLSTDPPAAGGFVAVIAAFGVLGAAAGQMARLLLGGSMLLQTIRFARPLLEVRPEPSVGRTDPGPLDGGIEVSDLTFRYGPDEPPVFSGLNLRITPGEMVAIVGRSGCGKSTLVRLLLGLETVNYGAVLYDGQDLRGLDLGVVRRQIGTVLQSGRLLPGSILDFIRGETGMTADEAWTAACAAGLEEDLRRMPMGLHTAVTDGSTLSGGQVQRILIARALAARPAMLILDEATSALDNVTQAQVMAGLSRMTSTRLIIAHRLSTIRNVNRILVLDRGRVAEQGTYDELVGRNGLLAKLVEAQTV